MLQRDAQGQDLASKKEGIEMRVYEIRNAMHGRMKERKNDNQEQM